MEDPLYVECRASPGLLGCSKNIVVSDILKDPSIARMYYEKICSGTRFFYQSRYYEDHSNWDPNDRGLAVLKYTLQSGKSIYYWL